MALSFAFFGDQPQDSPLSYEALQTRRKIAESLLGKRSPFPKNLGEGLTYAGERLGDVMTMRQLDEADARYQNFIEKEQGAAYHPQQTASAEPDTETEPSRTVAAPEAPAPTRMVSLQRPDQTEPPAINPAVRNNITSAITPPPTQAAPSPTPRAGMTLGMDQSVEFGGGPPAPAGPVGNAPARFFPSLTNPATGATRALPTQPPPNRFSREFGPLPNVPNVTAQPNAQDAISSALSFAPAPSPPVRMAAVQPSGNPPIMTDIPQAPPAAAPAPAASSFNDRFAIPPAPTPASAPVQTAQAGPTPYTPIVPRVPTEEVELYPQDPLRPKPTPQSPRELEALQRMARFPGDPNVQRIWGPIAQAEAAKRTFADKIIDQEYQARLGRVTTAKAENQSKARTAAEDELKRRQQEADLPTLAPAGQVTPGVVQTTFGPYDTRLGTAASPQRNGQPQAEPVPPGAVLAEWAKAQSKKIQADIEAGEKAAPQFKQMINLLQQANAHEGREYGVGALGPFAGMIYGSKALGFAKLIEQIQNQNFLSAYETLRGGGQIANIEGTKATEAKARLSRAQSKEDFQTALNEFEQVVRDDYARVQRRLHQPVTAYQLGPNDKAAPDIGEIDASFDDGIPRRYLGGNPRVPTNWQRLR